jgi:hypothetical protein
MIMRKQRMVALLLPVVIVVDSNGVLSREVSPVYARVEGFDSAEGLDSFDRCNFFYCRIAGLTHNPNLRLGLKRVKRG